MWTGTEMIIWGGSVGEHVVNTGGKYNPSTDTWTSMDSVGRAFCAIQSHGSVDRQRNDRLGRHDDFLGPPFNVFNTGGRYNPSTETWTATNTTNAPDARSSHTAVWTGSEMIVWGGSDESSNV